MSGISFGAQYASLYDALYSDKDYEAECDLIEEVVRRYGGGKFTSVLDLGCGTGGHSLPLSQRGYAVTGVDLSEPMLVKARLKADEVEFVRGDVRELDLGRRYDVVLMMFAVLGYQTSDEDLERALGTVARHLERGGLFIGDIWYGPAVVAIQPSERSKVVQMPDGELTRLATPSLDPIYNLCTVDYKLVDGAGVVVGEEQHTMRYFFPEELARWFSKMGLELRAMHSFPDLNSDLTPSTWNALFCASAS